ncbi:hypothetical protein A6U92_16940 [Agrobacterium rubi]|nr:hypothetical protein A6U92_16940 [Agrobacterium rubi]
MRSDTEKMLEAARVQGKCWSGVVLPSDIAARQAKLLESTWKGYVALHATLGFDEEPSSFEAALRECKVGGSVHE